MAQISTNNFNKGLNKDIELKKQPNTTLRDAVNIDLTEEGNFGALTNMRGSKFIVDILETTVGVSEINILGAFDCIGLFNGEEKPAIIYFVKVGIPTETDRIIVVDIEGIVDVNNNKNPVAHQLYPNSNDSTSLNFPSEGTVDAYYHREKNKNQIYFVDHVNPIRVIKVDQYAEQTLKGITLRPKSHIDNIIVINSVDGGDLLAGTYQFAFRYHNTQTLVQSTWSLITNPFPIVKAKIGFGWTGGKIGEKIGEKILLNVVQSAEGKKGFDAIQLAVVKNNDGSKLPQTLAFLLTPSTEWFINPSTIEYAGTETTTSVDISELVIEDANVLTSKTIEQKDGHLFLGNVKFTDLSYDKGDPTFSNVITKQEVIDGGHTSPHFTNKFKSYWREEVYRFGITYMDEFGNWAPPRPLDFSPFHKFNIDTNSTAALKILSKIFTSATKSTELTIDPSGAVYSTLGKGDWIGLFGAPTPPTSGVASQRHKVISVDSGTNKVVVKGDTGLITSSNERIKQLFGEKGNHAQADVKDFKFPSREIPEFSLLDSKDDPTAIGLTITGIKNHPSWAKAFAIVRLPRKKNIIFQTPQINTIAVEGVLTPGDFFDSTTATNVVEEGWISDNNTQGYNMKEDHFAPKAHFRGVARNIVAKKVFGLPNADRLGDGVHSPEFFVQRPGNTIPERATPPLLWGIVPGYIYNDKGDPFNDNDQDKAKKLRVVDAVLWKQTFKVGTKAIIIFDALEKGQYFYSRDGKIDDNGNTIFFENIEDTKGFDTAWKEVGIDPPIQRFTLNDTGGLLLQPNVMGGIFKNIKKFGTGTQLSINQGKHKSVPADAGFGEPVENQRGLVIKLSEELPDFTFTAFGNRTESGNNYKIFFPSADYKNKIGNVIQDTPTSGNALIINFLQNGEKDSALALGNVVDAFASETGGDFVGAAFILNGIVGLGDDRYGSFDVSQDYIFTGAYRALTASEVTNNTPINIDVFGGDCFISRASIKVNNSTSTIKRYNPDEDDGLNFDPKVPFGASDGEDIIIANKTGSHINRVEILDFYVESEVNTKYQAQEDVYPEVQNSINIFKKPYTYDYNPGYSIGNKNKIFPSQDKSDDTTTHFPARIVFSDKKILQSNIIGFNRFRALNLKDLEETFGGITKIIRSKDGNMYVLQEGAVRYIPVSREIIEFQSGETKELRTASAVIGDVSRYITTERGCQHIRTVKRGTNFIYFADARHKKVLRFTTGSQLETISDKGMYDFFFDKLSRKEDIPENALMGGYDNNREEYWIFSPKLNKLSYPDPGGQSPGTIGAGIALPPPDMNTDIAPSGATVGDVITTTPNDPAKDGIDATFNGATGELDITTTFGTPGVTITNTPGTSGLNAIASNDNKSVIITIVDTAKFLKLSSQKDSTTQSISSINTAAKDILLTTDTAVAVITKPTSGKDVPVANTIIADPGKNIKFNVDNDFAIIFSERLDAWKTEIKAGRNIYNATFVNKEFYLTTIDVVTETNIKIPVFSLYSDADKRGNILGEVANSIFTIVFNGQADLTKTFDVLLLYATNRLNTGKFTVIDELQLAPDQIADNVDLNIAPDNAIYKINKLRDDITKRRLRGQYMQGEFVIDNKASDRKVSVSNIICKFRESFRSI